MLLVAMAVARLAQPRPCLHELLPLDAQECQQRGRSEGAQEVLALGGAPPDATHPSPDLPEVPGEQLAEQRETVDGRPGQHHDLEEVVHHYQQDHEAGQDLHVKRSAHRRPATLQGEPRSKRKLFSSLVC
jgi:hypothetical protein